MLSLSGKVMVRWLKSGSSGSERLLLVLSVRSWAVKESGSECAWLEESGEERAFIVLSLRMRGSLLSVCIENGFHEMFDSVVQVCNRYAK